MPWLMILRPGPGTTLRLEQIAVSYIELFSLYLSSGGSSTDYALDQLDVDIHPGLVNRFGNPGHQNSDSDGALELGIKWSEKCEASHVSCKSRGEEHALPSRVLDVQTKDNTGEQLGPRLVLSKGLRGRYAALSHRWTTASEQFCTTKDNLEQHMDGIKFEDLPRTFQDSIFLCLEHGIRYLWIDCLCIIQDSDEDWQNECQNMCSIFEKSFITFSALRSGEDGGGLFHERILSDQSLMRTKDGTLLGIRRGHTGLHALENDVRTSSMGRRGWILQEKILSPATLHFGAVQMHWECKAMTISEFWANFEIPGAGVLKNIIREVQRPGCFSHVDSHFTMWYFIVGDYSYMFLTFEHDRLAAISGLADRFSAVYGTTYAAGIWLEDIHRGLLWMRGMSQVQTAKLPPYWPENIPITEEQEPFQAPSWSWVGVASRHHTVQFEWDFELKSYRRVYAAERLTAETDLEIVDVSITPCPRIHRGALRGRLELWGVVVKVLVSPQVGSRYSIVTRRYRDQTIKPRRVSTIYRRHSHAYIPTPLPSTTKTSSSSTTPDDTSPFPPVAHLDCVLDTPTSASDQISAYCLIVADFQFEDSFKGFFQRESRISSELRCYLLLRRVEGIEQKRRGSGHGYGCRHPSDLGVFERIGMGAGERGIVEGFFGEGRRGREKRFLCVV
ncbi:hypothetical protein IFR05_003001 [Cadophora sp. M221]|nr:hypothetical protein IFR05_003001 [Cadophora sp. M221]